MDVAQGLANLIDMPPTPRTLSFPGPSTVSYQYLLDMIASLTYEESSRAPTLPKSLALFIARLAQLPWFPMISPDEVIRRYLDDVSEKVVSGKEDWEVVGVKPTEVEQNAISYLRRFRSGANYNRPVVFPRRPELQVSTLSPLLLPFRPVLWHMLCQLVSYPDRYLGTACANADACVCR
jgi:NADH dehydrogenase (ubiquinone) 1 alpha subcomplex subunit 9